MNPRAAGVLLHPSSLANPYPIGDLGPAATAFADFLAEAGQRWWQMLPIDPVGSTNSPYQSSSAFAGNPLLVSLDRLTEQGLLVRADLDLPIPAKEGKVDYGAAALLKLPALRKAFGRFESIRDAGARAEFDAFARENSFWLGGFCCSRQSRKTRARQIGRAGARPCERANPTLWHVRKNTLPIRSAFISSSNGSSQRNGRS